MSLTVYRGVIQSKKIVESKRLRAALEAEIGVQCVPLQLTIALTHFKDLTEKTKCGAETWMPCFENDDGAIYEYIMAEYIVGLSSDGKTYIKTLGGASEVNLNYECIGEESNEYVEVEFICPQLELGVKYRKDGNQIRTAAPHIPGSRLLWRLENCILSNVQLNSFTPLSLSDSESDSESNVEV